MSSTTDEESADEEITTCATCRRDGYQICIGCDGAPDCDGRQFYTTYYCSRECQADDWRRTHKHACTAARNRRAMYRVGDIAQLAFYAYLERLYEVPVTKVEKQGDTLFLHRGKNDQNFIMPFPGRMFNDKDRHAALTVMTSGNALGFVHILVERLLGNVVQRVARVDHIPKNCKRRVILVSSAGEQIDNTTQNHAIIQITFQNGEQFAIDITGAQHGYAEPIMPWRLYLKYRVEEIKAAKSLESIDEWKILVEMDVRKRSKAATTAKMREEEFTKVWAQAVEQWQRRTAFFGEMLRSKDILYERHKTTLLAFIDKGVREHKADMQNNGSLSRQSS